MQHTTITAVTISFYMVRHLLLLMLITGASTLLRLIAVVAVIAMVGVSRISQRPSLQPAVPALEVTDYPRVLAVWRDKGQEPRDVPRDCGA